MGTLGRAFSTVGFCIRETVSRHRTLMNVFDKAPIVDKLYGFGLRLSFVRNAVMSLSIVTLWDVNTIIVGSGTNIQDNSLVHMAISNLSGKVPPTIIGDNICNRCTVEDDALSGWVQHFLTVWALKSMAWLLCDKTLEFLLERYGEETHQSSSGSSVIRKLIFFPPKSAEKYSNLEKVHAAENAKPQNAIEFEKGLRKR
ncbi:unnamed protein product [Eruca vesicaria subsp. sativa]|uniref:Uncharacterized protein n=1 Tax=Eruca vesicaria subsp. sativa TaxID=29727 RepID=A0ABC8LPP4_ERUVS|nr:unnamed protein product [Eruca vesicaria subsp. sativa]